MSDGPIFDRTRLFYSIAERANARGLPIPSYGDEPLVMFEKVLVVMLAEIDARLASRKANG